jgi:hypothetical protein
VTLWLRLRRQCLTSDQDVTRKVTQRPRISGRCYKPLSTDGKVALAEILKTNRGLHRRCHQMAFTKKGLSQAKGSPHNRLAENVSS